MVLSGCTHHQTKSTQQLVDADPLGPLYTETTALVDAYDRAMAATPELVPLAGQLRDECRQHATALAALIGIAAPAIPPGPDPSGSTRPSPPATPSPPAPSPSASPADPTVAARAQLSTAEKTAQQNAVNACVAAPADRVAVLASIAACRATHVAALR